jgi:UDP-N-acetylmuramate--alanine ligase
MRPDGRLLNTSSDTPRSDETFASVEAEGHNSKPETESPPSLQGRAAGGVRSVHLIGIGGMHMSAIAQVLMADGVRISGSDLQDTDLTRRLAALGATVQTGHAAANVGDVDLVVMTAAAKQDNPEVVEARRRSIPVIMRAEMVARLMEGRTGVAIAGTHGKTTTSSLITSMLVQAGKDPMYLLGGESLDLGSNAAPGTGEHIVVEADEYARAFLQYRPRLAVLTNIEIDHLDYYGTSAEMVDAFRQFLARVPADGVIIAGVDSPLVAELVAERPAAPVQRFRVVRAGEGNGRRTDIAGTDWLATDEGPNDIGGRTFVVTRWGQRYGRFESPRPMLYNVANALAAIAAGANLGLTADQMRTALRSFRGARRRFEPVGEAHGVTIVDDYAHHPTAVRDTLAGAHDRYPGRRIVLLFQPHTYSRTAYLLDSFRTSFEGADALYILETYAARETAEAGIGARDLVAQISLPPARYVASTPEAVRMLTNELRDGDVLITMGAGDVTTAGPAVLSALQEGDTGKVG